MNKKVDIQSSLRSLKDKWPSSVVARTQVEEFSGGALKKGVMANYDSRGMGPESFKIGRKKVYPVDGLIDWMLERASTE